MIRIRLLAAASATAVPAGAAIMLVSLVAAPGSWLDGYVSEAGTAGLPFAAAYRMGLLLLALGVAFLGVSLWRSLVAGLLVVAAVLAGVSGAVSCSGGCPLPPFEPTTAADVVHSAASIVGMFVLALAMAATWWADRQMVRGRLAAVAAALTVPLGGALGLTMLFAGRNRLGATLERLLLFVAVAWLVGTALLTLLRNSVKMESWISRPASPRSRDNLPS